MQLGFEAATASVDNTYVSCDISDLVLADTVGKARLRMDESSPD